LNAVFSEAQGNCFSSLFGCLFVSLIVVVFVVAIVVVLLLLFSFFVVVDVYVVSVVVVDDVVIVGIRCAFLLCVVCLLFVVW